MQKFYWLGVVLMAISALFFPFWLTGLIFVAGTLLFRSFYPGLIIFFIMDALYGFETIKVVSVYGMLTICGILGYVILQFLKTRLIFSPK